MSETSKHCEARGCGESDPDMLCTYCVNHEAEPTRLALAKVEALEAKMADAEARLNRVRKTLASARAERDEWYASATALRARLDAAEKVVALESATIPVLEMADAWFRVSFGERCDHGAECHCPRKMLALASLNRLRALLAALEKP